MVDRNVTQRGAAEARERDGWFIEISRLVTEWYSSKGERSRVSIVSHIKENPSHILAA